MSDAKIKVMVSDQRLMAEMFAERGQEIERLRSRVNKLEAALRWVEAETYGEYGVVWERIHAKAYEALEQ